MKKIFSLFAAVLFAGSMMAAEVLSTNFKQSQGDWTIDNVELDGLEFVWAQSSQYGMKASGYVNNTNHTTDALLISPAFDLTGAQEATLNFSHARKYGDLNQLFVLAKAGEEDWTVLAASPWPDGSNWNFIDATADLAEFVGKSNVQVAFEYTSSAEGGATWEIASASVVTDGEGPVGADVTFLPADFAGQGTASTGGEVSTTKDGVTVSSNKAYGHDAALRVYKDGSFSIVSETEQIGKIVFTFGSYQGTPKDGGLEPEIVVNAKEFTVDAMASAAWFEKIEIYFGEVEPIVIELDTITVAEAVEIAKALTPEKGSSAKTEKKYAVKGFARVKDATNKTYYMTDVADAYSEFLAYKCASIDKEVVDGDFVIVTGKIEHYWGSNDSGEWHNYEISGGVLEHAEAPEGIENIVMTENAQKVVVDGIIYIVRDGKMFNLQGAQVR